MGLGKWAVIDIETTGVDPVDSDVIDVGYLLFEGTKLTRQFESLVHVDYPIPPTITKLTSITDEQLKKAPRWEAVQKELWELQDANLLAHNAEFEKKFLNSLFPATAFQDSIPYLALLNIGQSTLNLEKFIQNYVLSEKELHRGLADSIDLLKVLLMSSFESHMDPMWRAHLEMSFIKLPQEFWFKEFFTLSKNELLEIAEQIDFDLAQHFEFYIQHRNKVTEKNYLNTPTVFGQETIKNVLQNETNLKTLLPHFQYRESQEQMSLQVGRSFKQNVHAIIQAPTGTGKTLAYMLPASLFSMQYKSQVLVATGTKALQEQLESKDKEIVEHIFSPEKIKIKKLIGSQNHLCELMFRNDENDAPSFIYDEAYSKVYFDLVFLKNQFLAPTDKITRENIPYALKRNFKAMEVLEGQIAVDYRACVGSNCPFVKNCSYLQSLREAKEADVIIGNHSLMFLWPQSIPKPAYIVVDEAHKIEQEATKAFGQELSENQFKQYLKSVPQAHGALMYLYSKLEMRVPVDGLSREDLTTHLHRMEDGLNFLSQNIAAFFQKLPSFNPLYASEIPFPNADDVKDEYRWSINNHTKNIFATLEVLYPSLKKLMENIETLIDKDSTELQKAKVVIETNLSHLEHSFKVFSGLIEHQDKMVETISFKEGEGFSFIIQPIDVGSLVFENLLTPSNSVVFTSATLASSDGLTGTRLAEWTTGYQYLKPEKRYKTGMFLPSVFDYENKARVFIADDALTMNDPMFVPRMIDNVKPIIEELGGKTLFLMSSKARFQLCADLLIKMFDQKIPVFVQGIGKNVVEEFQKSTNGILVGMEAFGEGIDIPGDKVQFVVIDKIPDIRQDLIIQKRREYFEQSFGNEFQDYFLASRTRSLHQKCGRLLRTQNDWGAILIFDSRIKKWKTNTLKSFAALMKPYAVRFSNTEEALKEIQQFLFKAKS